MQPVAAAPPRFKVFLAAWHLYRLHAPSAAPGLFVLPPPLEASVALEAETCGRVLTCSAKIRHPVHRPSG